MKFIILTFLFLSACNPVASKYPEKKYEVIVGTQAYYCKTIYFTGHGIDLENCTGSFQNNFVPIIFNAVNVIGD